MPSLLPRKNSSRCACGAIVIPSDFGLSTLPRSGGSEFFTQLKSDIETISTIDFSELGIKKTNE